MPHTCAHLALIPVVQTASWLSNCNCAMSSQDSGAQTQAAVAIEGNVVMQRGRPGGDDDAALAAVHAQLYQLTASLPLPNVESASPSAAAACAVP